jgi:MFS transporter, SP family, arabinose:H+ symporter
MPPTEWSNRDAQGSLFYLTFLAVVAALGGLLFGFDTVVISGTVTLLRVQFHMSPAVEGWLVSSALLGCVVGAAIAGQASDRFGRKISLITSGILFIVGTVGWSMAPTLRILISSRLLGGVGVGLASMVSPLYISEVSPPRLRGRLVTLFQFAITAGICLALFSNAWLLGLSVRNAHSGGVGFLHWIVVKQVWRSMFGMEIFPAMLFTILCLAVPETPRWLVKSGDSSKAKSILIRTGGEAVACREILEIEQAVSHESGSTAQLFSSGLRKALFIALFLAVVSELSGITVVLYYGPGILENAGLTLGQALGGFVSIGLVNMVFTLIAIWLMDSVGRRPLLLAGNTGAFVALATIGVLFAIGQTKGSLLVGMLCLFVACFAFSMGPIKWVVMSEIFPTRIRGRAMAIATLAVWVTDGIYNQLFPMVRGSLGVAGSFFVFAAVLVPQFFFVWKVMPETKGRTLEEIEQSWNKEPVESPTHPVRPGSS